MMRELSHDEAWAELDALAFDALDAAAGEPVRRHVEQCAVCRAELAVLRATVAELAYAAPVVAAPEVETRVRTRLMARASAGGTRHSALGPRPSALGGVAGPSAERRAPSNRVQWLALAAGILLVASLAGLASVIRERNGLRATLALESGRTLAQSDSLRLMLASRDSLIAGLTGRDVAMVELASSTTRDPKAMMFWDRARNGWTLIAHNLPTPRAGRTYQLWLVTPTSKISAGTFAPENGDAMVRATYALARDSLRAVAVTDEPAGGMPQPTGPMVIAGQAATR